MDGALEPHRQNGALTLRAARPKPSLAEFEHTLGYTFRDPERLVLALTHVGAAATRATSYQRLEFLGDRVLGVVVAAMLYEAFPEAEEGELSRRLAALVRRETCTAVAESWNVEPHIRLVAGERSALRRAILGDICEAVIGALFLDGGIEAASALVRRDFGGRMQAPERPLRDPKTALQEWAQARKLPAPLYREISRSGPDHAPRFTVAVIVEEHADAQAQGASKRLAEQAAASGFMSREGIGEVLDTALGATPSASESET